MINTTASDIESDVAVVDGIVDTINTRTSDIESDVAVVDGIVDTINTMELDTLIKELVLSMAL